MRKSYHSGIYAAAYGRGSPPVRPHPGVGQPPACVRTGRILVRVRVVSLPSISPWGKGDQIGQYNGK